MRGGFIHKDILIEPLAFEFVLCGAEATLEKTVRIDGGIGYIDLFVEYARGRIAIEAELTAKRIRGDLAKAEAIDADELWVLVPTARVRRAVLRQIRRLDRTSARPLICIFTLPQARQRVTRSFPLISGPNDARKNKKQRKARGLCKSNGQI